MKTKQSRLKWPAWAMLICAMFGVATFGQSLSITNAGGRFAVQGKVPPGNQNNLQASENLSLWVDVDEELPEMFTYFLNPTNVTRRYFRIAPKVEAPPMRLMIIGDSMSADCCGWGAGMYGYFKGNATVVNYAQPYASTKVFLQSAEMEKMLLIKPNYVLIQFAWFDTSAGDVDRMTTPEEFVQNLKTIIETVRGFNGTPILVTLQSARAWDTAGNFIGFDHPRNEITRQLAVETNTQLIDVNKITSDLFRELGPAGSQFFHWQPGGPEDVLHISALGGQWISRLVIHQLPAEVGPYLAGIFDLPPRP